MKRTFEFNSEISVRLLAGIALLAVISTGVSLVAFQSARSDVAALIEDVDSLHEALSQAEAASGQTEENQANMSAKLGNLESKVEGIPELAVADFRAVAESLSVYLSSDAGKRRDEALSEIQALERLYESRGISHASLMNQLSPLQIKRLVNTADAMSNCLAELEDWQEADNEAAWASSLRSIRESLIVMEEENQYDADLIAVLQDQLNLAKSYTQAVLMRRVRDAAVSVAKSKGYDFVLDLASVVQVTHSMDVPVITEEIRGFLEQY